MALPTQMGRNSHLGLNLYNQESLLYNVDTDDLANHRSLAHAIGRATAEMVTFSPGWVEGGGWRGATKTVT